MDPYRTHRSPSVSKVKVVNGTSPRTNRSLEHVNNNSRDGKEKTRLWPINRNIANGFSPSTSANSVASHAAEPGISGFGFPPGSSANGYQIQHEFAGKPVFSSPAVQYRTTTHRNVDSEEAMDIDHQDDMDVHIPSSSASQNKLHCNESISTRWKVLNTSKLNLPSSKETSKPEQNTSSNPKEELCAAADNNSTSSRPVHVKSSKAPIRKRAIYVVLHVSDVVFCQLSAKASAPVKIYAEKLFLDIEFKDSSTISLRIPCIDFTNCTVCFDPTRAVISFTLSDRGMNIVKEKKKDIIVDSNKNDDAMSRIILHLNYGKTGVPNSAKVDLIELFQKRLSSSITWQELSSAEMTKFLWCEKKDMTAEKKSEVKTTDTSENTSQQQPSEKTSDRKILTPKKTRSNTRKPVFEGECSTPTSSKPNDESSQPKNTENSANSEIKKDTIVTRSRRRKAEAEATESKSPPKTSRDESGIASSNVEDSENRIQDDKGKLKRSVKERDILQHHSKMESHISLLGKHSEEQRHTLEHHQKLLTLERAERTRSFERIQELQSAQRQNQLRLMEKDENIALLEREVENQKLTLRQLESELVEERESSTLMRKVQNDLARVMRELEEEKVGRVMQNKQLQERQTEVEEIRRLYSEESNSRRRLEEELQRMRNSCIQHMDELENQRLFRQTQEHEIQGREERLQASEQRYQDERSTRINLEDQLRGLQMENDELRSSRDAFERDLAQERRFRQEETDTFARERRTHEQRLRESVRAHAECERHLQELQTTVNNTQTALDEHRRIEPRDWIIRREEVTLSNVTLGNGAWGSVKVGNFRGCKVAVKQIHELILSPHNRRLFEREMSIAARCRHPSLLQFIGATNDDGIPLFITEILDTDLRSVLSRRSLHKEEIFSIALDVARALNYLHLSKPFPIIHRDISSSNVLLWKRDACWRAKLSDYGAANFMRQYMTVNPGAGIYAAPESSTSQQSPKVDIYSYGLLLCELCIRELPVPQQTQEQITLVTNSMLRELIIRCVRVEPEGRPTMADIITLLEQQQENLLERGVVSLNGRSAAL